MSTRITLKDDEVTLLMIALLHEHEQADGGDIPADEATAAALLHDKIARRAGRVSRIAKEGGRHG